MTAAASFQRRRPVCKTAPRPGRSQGLTLIEMLVTLALVSALVLLLTEAMGQFYRVERLLDSGRLESQRQQLLLEQVRLAIESALPAAADSPDLMQGDERKLSFLSSEAPTFRRQGLVPMTLELFYSEPEGETQLRATIHPGTVAQAQWVVQRWAGRSGRWRYFDAGRREHASWPPLPTDRGDLPATIALDPETDAGLRLVADTQVTRKALPNRRELMRP